MALTSADTRPATGLIATLYGARSWLWIATAVAGAALTWVIMVVLPPQQTLANLGDWAFRLSPFVLGVLTVALLPPWRRLGRVLVVAAVVVQMGFLDTVMVLRVLAFGAAPAADQDAAFEAVYQFELFTATFVVLFGLLAHRMAGGRTTTVLKLGVASILVVISGLNDLTFWVAYRWPGGRPAELRWASHIAVFVGGPPTVAVAVVFMVVHLLLAGAVLAVPLGRIVDRALVDRTGREEGQP